MDFPGGNENDMGLTIYRLILADQIWLAWVVDIASLATEECSIDDIVFIQTEIVAITDT